ncbi:hypothetical protein F2Q68_00022379 [Brassica cretica]|uniref:Uncharacterized protein n=1 Tax=Brassica cretica TaxID=69181 RepID=A0A8S9G2H3_BRACR|nr:hypothetical protein F2Q68_00022379 [Brassica cretica]
MLVAPACSSSPLQHVELPFICNADNAGPILAFFMVRNDGNLSSNPPFHNHCKMYNCKIKRLQLHIYIVNSQPITLALVYAGTTLKDLSDVTHKWSEFSIGRWAFLISSLVISVILMVCVTKVAQNALRKALAEHGGDMDGAVAASPELNVTADTPSDLNEPLLIKIEPQSPQNQENNSH